VLGVGGEKGVVNIHVDLSKRKSLDKAAFSSADMHQFINELEGAHRSNRFVIRDTVLSLVAEAARTLIAIDMMTQGLTSPTARDAWQDWEAERLIQSLRKVYPAEAGNRFQPTRERWAEVASRVSNLEAIRVTVALGPTNNARTKFLVALV